MVSSLNFSDNFSKNSEIISSFLSISLIQILTLSVVLESDISEIRTLGSNILISNLFLNNILMLDNSNNFEIIFFSTFDTFGSCLLYTSDAADDLLCVD